MSSAAQLIAAIDELNAVLDTNPPVGPSACDKLHSLIVRLQQVYSEQCPIL